MRFSPFILIFLLSFGTSLIGQEDAKYNRQQFKGNMTDSNVIDAKRWHHQGKTEQSLKKGLEIIASNKSLTQIDSFHTFQILAYNFRRMEVPNPALEYAKKAVEVMYRIDPENNSKISWVAPYYSAVGKYDSAIVYMKRELKHLYFSTDTMNLLKMYNNIGFTYYLNNQQDSAVNYYNKVINFKGIGTEYKVVLGLTTGNLGTIYFEKGNYKKALTLMQIDAQLSEERNWNSYYNAMNAIGECYSLMGEYSDSKKALLKLVQLKHHNNKANLKTYRLLADVYSTTNEHAKSGMYLKKYIALKDSIKNSEIGIESILKQLSDSKINGIKKDLDLMDTELLLAMNREKSQELKNQIYFVTAVLSIIMILISIIYYRNRQKKNLEIHQLETELITAELKNKKKDLNNVITNLSYKRKFINEVQDKLKNLQQQPEEQLMNNITLLIREFSNYKSADKNAEVLQADIDKVNLSFFNQLSEKFPLLTENEKEMCGLFVLKLSSKDIAIIRNVTPNAIKKARQRIRKKLPISEDQKLTTFLESV